ncbi:AMP-binding protein [Mycobacterium marinum]|uniref:AMP-binding protein n=1 Tax=Mycobacterium marinum TaxID=1781 RepID=UPI0035691D33
MSRADVVSDMGEVAEFLRHHCGLEPGDRAILAYPSGLDFVRGLIGCLAAGVVPVPIYPPDPINPQKTVDRMQRVVASSGAKAVLTSRRYANARRLGTARSIVTGSTVGWPGDLPWHITSRGIGGRRMRGPPARRAAAGPRALTPPLCCNTPRAPPRTPRVSSSPMATWRIRSISTVGC